MAEGEKGMTSWIRGIFLVPFLVFVLWAGPALAVDESLYANLHLVRFKSPVDVPNFALPDVSGERVNFGDFEGKVILMSFWATW